MGIFEGTKRIVKAVEDNTANNKDWIQFLKDDRLMDRHDREKMYCSQLQMAIAQLDCWALRSEQDWEHDYWLKCAEIQVELARSMGLDVVRIEMNKQITE